MMAPSLRLVDCPSPIELDVGMAIHQRLGVDNSRIAPVVTMLRTRFAETRELMADHLASMECLQVFARAELDQPLWQEPVMKGHHLPN